jgi:uncharacterized protein (UPF0218 family)
MPLRRLPRAGDAVTVAFLAAAVPAEIAHVDERQRRVQVLTHEGEMIVFTLSRATGQFMAEGASAARLVFAHRTQS